MRRVLQVLYAVVVVVVMAGLARTCFSVRTSEVSKDVIQHVAKGARIVRSSAPNTDRPLDADRYTERPLAVQLLAHDSLTTALFTELTSRYEPALADFKRAAGAGGVQLVVVSFGVDGGRHASELERRSEPTIAAACKALQIPYYDFSPALDSAIDAGAKVVVEETAGPNGFHLSRVGAAIVANQMRPIVDQYAAHRSTLRFTDDQRPATFADFKPLENGVVDLGDGHPYLLKSNSQGLRMDYDLEFPKTKQRILLLGSSLAYGVFLDNDKTPTALLQAQYPDKEFLNGAMWAYGIRDELELFIDKAQFAEPDVVILEQDGMDVVRLFFSVRNFQDRAKAYHAPSPVEKAWYLAHFPAK